MPQRNAAVQCISQAVGACATFLACALWRQIASSIHCLLCGDGPVWRPCNMPAHSMTCRQGRLTSPLSAVPAGRLCVSLSPERPRCCCPPCSMQSSLLSKPADSDAQPPASMMYSCSSTLAAPEASLPGSELQHGRQACSCAAIEAECWHRGSPVPHLQSPASCSWLKAQWAYVVGQVSSAVCSQSLQLCELLPLLLGEVSSQGRRSQRGRIEVGHPHQTFSSSQRLQVSRVQQAQQCR